MGGRLSIDSIRAAVRVVFVSAREVLKNLAMQFAPTNHIEALMNYSILRASGTLLPRDVRTGIPKSAYFEAAYAHLNSEKPLLFMEFGSYKGKSIRKWAQMDKHPDSRFVGFDSFFGLPERWRRRPVGYFSTDGIVPEVADVRVSFVKGWFNKTLSGWLDDNIFPAESTTLIHIDSDLYSSCSYVLAALHRVLPSYYVMFDEFGAGEARALRDYMVMYGADFHAILGRKRRSFSRVPVQVFGKITSQPWPARQLRDARSEPAPGSG